MEKIVAEKFRGEQEGPKERKGHEVYYANEKEYVDINSGGKKYTFHLDYEGEITLNGVFYKDGNRLAPEADELLYKEAEFILQENGK